MGLSRQLQINRGKETLLFVRVLLHARAGRDLDEGVPADLGMLRGREGRKGGRRKIRCKISAALFQHTPIPSLPSYLTAGNSHGLRDPEPQKIILIRRRELSVQIQQGGDPKVVKSAVVLLPRLFGQGEEQVVEGQLEGVGEFQALQLDPVREKEEENMCESQDARRKRNDHREQLLTSTLTSSRRQAHLLSRST